MSHILGDESCWTKMFTADEFKALLEDNGSGHWRSWKPQIWRLEVSSFPTGALADKFTLLLRHISCQHYSERPVLVQFWVPRVVGGRVHHLTTSDQPFSIYGLYKGLCEYRKHSMGYDYLMEEDDDDNGRESSPLGPIGRAFRSGFPESSPDLLLYSKKEHPLRDVAVRCGLRGQYLALPVYDGLCGKKPVAVIEVLTRRPADTIPRSSIETAVKKAGFTSLFFETDLLDLENDFRNVLELAIDSVPELHLAQLWISPGLLSTNNAMTNFVCMERSYYWATGTPSANSTDDTDGVDDFVVGCEYQKTKSNIWMVGLGLSPKNSSFFSRNMGDLSIYVYPFAHYAQRARLSFCFAVCLRNREDGNKACVIEFFLQFDSRQDKNPFPILKSLLHIIDRKLKGYELSSGKSIGTEVPLEVSTKNNMLTPVLVNQNAQAMASSNSKELTVITKMVDWNCWVEVRYILSQYSNKFNVAIWKEGNWKKLNGREEELKPRRFIFSSLETGSLLECPSKDNSLISPVDEIQHKIKLLLSRITPNFHVYSGCLIQFWVVKQSDDKSYLVTKDQPFAFINPTIGMSEYRQWSVGHKYLLNEGEEELGPPGRVFRSKYPEYTHNLHIYSTKEFALRVYAIHCGFTSYMAFPIVLQNQNECAGVLEFIFSVFPNTDVVFNEPSDWLDYIKLSFEEANLRATHIMTNSALRKAYADDRNLALAEVEKMNHLAAMIPQTGKVYMWVQCNQCDNEKCMQLVMRCYQSTSIDMSHKVITRKGIIGTLLASESKLCFFPNLCDFNITEEQGILEARESRWNVCFAICLKSSHTGNDLYVFEFFLHPSCKSSENFCKFLSYLLPIMKEKLKSFKVASGREFGEELMIEVIKSGLETHEPNTPPIRFKISKDGEEIDGQQSNDHVGLDDGGNDFNSSVHAIDGEQNNISSMNLDKDVEIPPKKRGRQDKEVSNNISLQDLEPHVWKTLDVVAEEFGVSRSTIQRECTENNIQRWPSDTKNKGNTVLFRTPTSNDDVQSSKMQDFHGSSSKNVTKVSEEDVFTIKAKFKDGMAKIQLIISSKMEKLNHEVMRRFNIETGSFKLKYLDDDNDWILLVCDDDLQLCFKNLKASGKTLVCISVEPI